MQGFFANEEESQIFEQLGISLVNKKHSVLNGRLPDLLHFFSEGLIFVV